MATTDDPLGPVFKALADPSRRMLLDSLRHRNGQTLTQLGAALDMKRQSVTQHVDQLVEANLVAVVRHGRERLHYLNPVPIHDISERWIAAFEAPRLTSLSSVKHQAERTAMTANTETVPSYVYVTYINSTAERVWEALTDADLTARYWGHANVSDWQVGSAWEHRRVDGSGVDVRGEVLHADPPTKLTITFDDSEEERANGRSIVTFSIEQHDGIVRLTVTHENLPNVEMLRGISDGWPAVLANLKSLLETGDVLPTAPWNMPTGG